MVPQWFPSGRCRPQSGRPEGHAVELQHASASSSPRITTQSLMPPGCTVGAMRFGGRLGVAEQDGVGLGLDGHHRPWNPGQPAGNLPVGGEPQPVGIDMPVVEGIVVVGLPIERAIRLRHSGNGGIGFQADRMDNGVGGRMNDQMVTLCSFAT